MGFRSYLATWALNNARSFGRMLGCELVVETSQHSLATSMEVPTTNTRAWDDNLWKRGQLYISGYANPVKPYIEHHIDQGDQDQVRIISSELEDDEDHTAIVSSTMYRMYQDQHLASELLLPSEQWRLIFYALLGIGAMILIGLGIDLSVAAGYT